MKRDFTYISDLVKSISLLIKCIPERGVKNKIRFFVTNSLACCQYRKLSSQNLSDFISEIEKI